ncbi:MAG: hypothetical protein RLZZ383_1808 [Pseudomonadota bacterium]|jgi:hypothetical protein
MSFFQALRAKPDVAPSRLSRFTVYNGYGYLGIGALFYAAPRVLLAVPGYPPFEAHEEGFVRALGLTVAIIGWFYVFGGRAQSTSFSLATVVDRLLVPLFLAPLIVTDAIPAPLGIAFSVLDPALGLMAWGIWRSESGGK